MTNGPIKATGQNTAGAYTLLDFVVPPGDEGPPLHVHHRTGEAFYVIEGTLAIRLDDEDLLAGPGSFVFVRPGVAHAFAVRGATSARFLVILPPPDFVEFFQQMLGQVSDTASGSHDIELIEEV